MRAIIDSDVLIDYLLGEARARREIDHYEAREISVVSWMEVMAGANTPAEEAQCLQFLGTCKVHAVSNDVAREAVALRKLHRVKLPDAIVWATARVEKCLLVTRNTRDFPAKDPGVRFPYRLSS